MKRQRVDDTLIKEASGSPLYNLAIQSSGNSQSTGYNSSILSASNNIKVVSEGMQSGLYTTPSTVNYGVMPTATVPPSSHSGKSPSSLQPLTVGHSQPMRSSIVGSPPMQEMQPNQALPPQQQSPGSNFQRLKVEDALSYLDRVKFKFASTPQVYNDFLDIMKEFKSQSIDTPGVIQRVSILFKGYPDLIVGFNTFLPPGYKIEVQKSDQGYAFQVSVSMPSPTGDNMQSSDPNQQQKMIMRGSGTINMASQHQVSSVVVATPPPQPPAPPNSLAISGNSLPQCHQPLLASSGPPIAAPPQAQPPSIPVVHHSSNYGSGAPNYNSLTLSAAQVVTQALQGHTADAPQNQPVQFNHAINYVNKIKHRFQDQPEKYKKFLDILHIYQKEQRTMKESNAAGPGGKHLTEQEVYSQVAKLFENQEDLLVEFGQFLPDATSHINQSSVQISEHSSSVVKKPQIKQQTYRDNMMERIVHNKPSHHHHHHLTGQQKRSPPYQLSVHRDAPPPKKHKVSSSCRDVTLAEAAKYGNLHDYAFFDKVRKALRAPEVYNNFLRCLNLFNQEIISKSELIAIINPFLGKCPDLFRWFREFLGQNDVESIPYNVARSERPQGEQALEIDLTTAKRLGASYCVIPPAQEGLACSGRTQLCKQVLNDQWVSFPTWSEDSTFVSSRKTQYEEFMYRCEDERFELDVVIETNASTIRVLEGVHKKLQRMSADEVAKYRLDDCLGGSSPTLHQRALKRIYGDKAHDIIDGLKRNPIVAVPVVLRRLKAKEEEWREAQKGFNKIWREQNEKYYLKSLDHQGINFKQTDVKALRSKSLFNEIETLFDERHEQNDEGGNEMLQGPHLVLTYKDRAILDDAANLLIHHVKRQTSIQKGEKRRIKHLMRQFIPELFFHPKQQLTDDEREDDDDKEEGEDSSGSSPSRKKSESSPGKSPGHLDPNEIEIKADPEGNEDTKVPLHAQSADPDEAYSLFIANNNWYIFMRLHAILCERLVKIYDRAVIMATEEAKSRTVRKESTAIALRLKPKPQIEIEDYYVSFLDMIKNLLDGNMDANTFEDTLREMFGIHAYIAFTLDKVIVYAVRQLQHCVTERTAIACTDLFFKEQKRNATGGACATAYKRSHIEMQYQRAGEKAVQEDSCFKIFVYKKDNRMTIELLDTEAEAPKKVDEAKKWNSYKDCYANLGNSDCGNGNKARSPVYLNRNLRLYKKRMGLYNNKIVSNNQSESSSDDQQAEKRRRLSSTSNVDNDNNKIVNESDKKYGILEMERKLNERGPPERNQTEHPGYMVSDETQCQFNSQGSKLTFTVNKDSYLYKISAFSKAKKTHPEITKRLSVRFRAWLKKWATVHVSDVQHKQCTDWLMGRCDGVIPNRTRVLTDNDLARTPYVSYNRYRVERLNEDTCTNPVAT